MRIPILSYQPAYIHGNDYASNHLVALAADLEQVTEAGFRIVPLASLVAAWRAGDRAVLDGKVVAITCDDSGDFATRALPHPTAGLQPSVLEILRRFADKHPGSQESLHVTTFEIASPEARAALDATCRIGQGWWNNDWWATAVASGLMHVANHSWDHNHAALPDALLRTPSPGSFKAIADEALADYQIRQAATFLATHAPNPGTALFAYPYGESNEFLTRRYLPGREVELGIHAAFTGEPGYWNERSDRWAVPRFVCTRDWSSPEGLAAILEGASAPSPAARGSSGPRDLRQFARFVQSRVEPIPGWLHLEAALLTAHMTAAQRELGISGPALEIGVYQGKYLSVLYALAEPSEALVGVDLYVGARDTEAAAATTRDQVQRACGHAAALDILVADSMELDARSLSARCGIGTFRFISIDAGHTRELVYRDLQTAAPLLAEGGIMALDDVFNYGTPGVTEGVFAFFREQSPRLAPFAFCFNKLFVTTSGHHARYLAAAAAFLESARWLDTCARTRQRRTENAEQGFVPALFGHEIVAFI